MTSLALKCPCCGEVFFVPDCSSIADTEGCTMDCAYCGKLLATRDGKVVDFHAWIHEQDARWPADGKGTGYVEF